MGWNLGQFLQGAANNVGQAIDNVIPGNQSYLHASTASPQRPAPQPASTRPQPNFIQQAGNALTNPLGFAGYNIGKYVAPVAAQATNWLGNTAAQGINKLDNNYSAPIIGNVGNAVGGLISAPAVTMQHTGQILQGQNPYQGMSLPQAAGSFGVDALNAATLGKGGSLGAAVGERVAGKLGGGVFARALGNTVGTTLSAAPITAGYGAAGTLASGDTNPMHVLQNAALGLATAPVMGLAHGAMPIVGSAIKATSKGVAAATDAGISKLPATTVHAYQQLAGETPAAAADRFISGAQADKPHFINAVKSAADNVGGSVSAKAEANAVKGISSSGVKDPTRMIAKIEKKGQITDALRSTIVAKDPNAAPAVIDHMQKQGYQLWNDPKTGQPDFTNRHVNRQPGDYTDIAMKFVKNQNDPIVKELQLIQPKMADAKANGGHTHYEAQQAAEGLLAKTTDPTTRAALQSAIDHHMKQSGLLYDKAYALDNPGLASAAAPMTAKASKSLSPNGTPIRAKTALRSATEVPPNALTPSSASRSLSGDSGMVPPSKSTIAQKGAAVNPTSGATKLKTPGLTKGIKSSPNFTPELQKTVKAQYAPATDKAALASHEDFAKQPLNDQHQQAISALSDPKGHITKQDVVNYGKTIQALDAAGRTTDANAIHDLLYAKLTNAGQVGQAAHLLYNRTPDGLKNLAFRDLRNAKVELTPKIKADIQTHIDAIKSMQDGKMKDFAIAVLQKEVAKHLPQSKVGNAISIWKAGLLSGVKTQEGNLVSNATFAGLKKVADPISVAADKAMSVVTGKREKSLTWRGDISGAKEGLSGAKTTMKTGIDMRQVGDKYEQHAELNLKNPILQKTIGNATNTIFRGMSAADQPFWYSALKNSLYDQAKASGLTLKLKGRALTDHMNTLVSSPTEKMASVAEHEANKSTLAYDTIASKAVSGLHQGIENFKGASPAGKMAAHSAVDILAPFTKVPSAFLSRTVDFTPLGPVKEVLSQIGHKQFSQRNLAQAIGEGATGTGVVAIGMALANTGQLSGDYPKNDPKEAARWKAEGITANSVKIGGQWIALNYLGPLGLLFNAGNKIVQAQAGGAGKASQAGAALAGLGQGLLGQSFLQGFSGFSNAIQDPNRSLTTFVHSQAASVVPNLINDIGNVTDPMQRQANTVLEAIQARIPGLRQKLAAKTDSFGNDLSQPSSGLNTALNPFKPSNSVDSPMLSELNRLGKTGKDNVVFPVAVKSIGSGKTAIKLTPEQATQRQKMLGSQLTPLWNSIISDPAYAKLDDGHKALALKAALTDLTSAVDRQMTRQVAPGQAMKPATGATAQILNGATPSAASYIAKAANYGTGVSSQTSSQKYQTKLVNYQNAVAAGTLTGAKAFATGKSLNKSAITSQYPQAVQDLYRMGKAQQSAYLSTLPADQAQSLYQQAQQLDSQLTSSGQSKTKYKNGLSSAPKAARTPGVKKFSFNTGRSSSSSALRKLLQPPKLNVPKSTFKQPKLASYSAKQTSAKIRVKKAIA